METQTIEDPEGITDLPRKLRRPSKLILDHSPETAKKLAELTSLTIETNQEKIYFSKKHEDEPTKESFSDSELLKNKENAIPETTHPSNTKTKSNPNVTKTTTGPENTKDFVETALKTFDQQISLEILPSHKVSTHHVPEILRNASERRMTAVDRFRKSFGITNEIIRATLAELFATGFLVFAGCCVNAQYVLSKTRHNAWIGVCIGWGLALVFAVQMAYRVSGAHLNPAVSFFQLTQGKISPLRFILFAIAQNVGAFFGALMTFLVYWDLIDAYDGGIRFVTGPQATAGIFGTFPAPRLSFFGGLFDQIVGTAVLCMLIACVVDRRNRIPPFLQPAFIGTILVLIGMSLGMNAGYAINPARDFGPRLFSLIAGYGWRVFSYRDYSWFWIPWVGPMIGAVIGAWVYEIFIGFHIPDDPDTTYIHRIIDDRNPDGNLREIHLVETRPASERIDTTLQQVPPPQQIQTHPHQPQQTLSYRNL